MIYSKRYDLVKKIDIFYIAICKDLSCFLLLKEDGSDPIGTEEMFREEN